MPLLRGNSNTAIAENIRELQNSGHPELQAVAAAHRMARGATPTPRATPSVRNGPLDVAERAALPDSAFALPGREYPIHNVDHARAALTDVARVGTETEKKIVRARVKARYPAMQVQES